MEALKGTWSTKWALSFNDYRSKMDVNWYMNWGFVQKKRVFLQQWWVYWGCEHDKQTFLGSAVRFYLLYLGGQWRQNHRVFTYGALTRALVVDMDGYQRSNWQVATSSDERPRIQCDSEGEGCFRAVKDFTEMVEGRVYRTPARTLEVHSGKHLHNYRKIHHAING
jgi:hypothetical protein